MLSIFPCCRFLSFFLFSSAISALLYFHLAPAKRQENAVFPISLSGNEGETAKEMEGE